MTELQLYRFINDNCIEYKFNHKNGEDEIFAFVDTYLANEFSEILGFSILRDEGLSCKLKNGYFVFEMVEICDYFGIDPANVFENKD